jgi:hypothetical membrane protein
MKFNQMIGASLLLIGSAQFLVFLNLAEVLYPDYSISLNTISDLGATCHSNACVFVQPSSLIFNSSVVLLGAFIMLGSYFLFRDGKSKIFCSFLFLSGLGAIGVGAFTETTGSVHTLVSFIAFFFGGLAAIYSSRFLRTTLRYFSLAMGVITLAALVLYGSDVYLGLGEGGMERMITFPVLFWGLAFAGNLLA